jgi:hypothetical protein
MVVGRCSEQPAHCGANKKNGKNEG